MLLAPCSARIFPTTGNAGLPQASHGAGCNRAFQFSGTPFACTTAAEVRSLVSKKLRTGNFSEQLEMLRAKLATASHSVPRYEELGNSCEELVNIIL